MEEEAANLPGPSRNMTNNRPTVESGPPAVSAFALRMEEALNRMEREPRASTTSFMNEEVTWMGCRGAVLTYKPSPAGEGPSAGDGFPMNLLHNKKCVVLNFDRNKIGRIFVLSAWAEGFQDLMDTLAEMYTVGRRLGSKSYTIGTNVLAIPGEDMDPRDANGMAQYGGLLNKPWRGVVVENSVDIILDGGTSHGKSVHFPDLGIVQFVPFDRICLPRTNEANKVPHGKFGGWVSLSCSFEAGFNRRFFMKTYCDFMERFVLFKATNVVNVAECCHEGKPPHVELRLARKSRGPTDLKDMIDGFQIWLYESRWIKNIQDALQVVRECDKTEERITPKEMAGTLLLEMGKTYQGSLLKVDSSFWYIRLQNDHEEDDYNLWRQHIINYHRLHPMAKDYYPCIGEMFCLRLDELEGTGEGGEWRRVYRMNTDYLLDMDNPLRMYDLKSLQDTDIILPIPTELLTHPLGNILATIDRHQVIPTGRALPESTEGFVRISFESPILTTTKTAGAIVGQYFRGLYTQMLKFRVKGFDMAHVSNKIEILNPSDFYLKGDTLGFLIKERPNADNPTATTEDW